MGQLVFQATLGGQVNLVGPNTASTFNINVPAVAGNMVTTGDTATVTNTMLAGSIANAKLTNSSVTIGSTNVALGATAATVAGLTLTNPVINGFTGDTSVINVGSGQFYKDTSGNVGIGTSVTNYKLKVLTAPVGAGDDGARVTDGTRIIQLSNTGSTYSYIGIGGSENMLYSSGNPLNIVSDGQPIKFIAGTAERARIDTSGNLLVGTTSTSPTSGSAFIAGTATYQIMAHASGSSSGAAYHRFDYNTTAIGSITQAGTTGVLYNVTSDYRLKNVIGPVAGAGERIDALEPIEYQWKSDGSNTRGFLAHKFQEVYPQSVSGEKDAVDEDGNPKYQNMQAGTSEVIADFASEIQSIRKRLAALEAK